MRNKIITSVFCLLLAVGVLSGFFVPDKYYSESEKRTLTQKDAISISDFPSGKMGTEIEKYLSDQFPLRDDWITVKTLTQRLSGKTQISGVYFGKDGYLIDAFTSYNQKQFAVNIEALTKLSESLKAAGIPMQVMLVPTAAQTLSDKLPAYAPNLDQKALMDLAKAQGLDTVNVFDILSEHIRVNTSTIRQTIILRVLVPTTAMLRGCRHRERLLSRFPLGRAKRCAIISVVLPITRSTIPLHPATPSPLTTKR